MPTTETEVLSGLDCALTNSSRCTLRRGVSNHKNQQTIAQAAQNVITQKSLARTHLADTLKTSMVIAEG